MFAFSVALKANIIIEIQKKEIHVLKLLYKILLNLLIFFFLINLLIFVKSNFNCWTTNLAVLFIGQKAKWSKERSNSTTSIEYGNFGRWKPAELKGQLNNFVQTLIIHMSEHIIYLNFVSWLCYRTMLLVTKLHD